MAPESEYGVAGGGVMRLDWQAPPADNPRQRRPDITRARALLGWVPDVQLDEGLVATIAHFRAVLALA